MDKAVKPRKNARLLWWIFAAVALTCALVAMYLFIFAAAPSMRVDSERVILSKVTRGSFDDFIPLRATVEPAKTLFLDAVEGGRVEKIHAEDGAFVAAGQLLVELSNTTLQLSALGNETRVAEQLNTMRSIELSLEQNRLQHKRNLADIRYQIKLLSRRAKREQQMRQTGAISEAEFADTQDTLAWYKTRLELTLESQASDAQMQQAQLAFLRDTAERLQANLAISRANLDNMNVRAPTGGRLSGFNLEVGQSIGKGERIGQIDAPDDFKLSALVDEFYLNRVAHGLQGSYGDYPLVVSKVYPQVNNGRFKIDLQFVAQQASKIRRGQSMQIELSLDQPTQALLIPNGGFFQDTGGQWIFVLDQDSTTAIRRKVTLGRRNVDYVEVLDGLAEGEQVITSSYRDFQDMQILTFY